MSKLAKRTESDQPDVPEPSSSITVEETAVGFTFHVRATSSVTCPHCATQVGLTIRQDLPVGLRTGPNSTVTVQPLTYEPRHRRMRVRRNAAGEIEEVEQIDQ